MSRGDNELTSVSEVIDAMLPGKASKHKCLRTVPETDTGGQVENTEALR